MDVLLQDRNRGAVSLSDQFFLSEVAQGRIWRELPASIDGGKTWMPAWQLDLKLRARGDDGVALLMPMRTEAWSMVAGYLGVFSLLFFGGPISFGVAILSFDKGPTKLIRLAFVLGGMLLGPAPIAGTAELGRRALLKDPTLRGKGRMIFAFVVAGILALPCLVGLVGALLR
ncbi:MAG: hypothetical protein ABI183_14385 [Polyangiaceae bacterium]